MKVDNYKQFVYFGEIWIFARGANKKHSMIKTLNLLKIKEKNEEDTFFYM